MRHGLLNLCGGLGIILSEIWAISPFVYNREVMSPLHSKPDQAPDETEAIKSFE